MAPFPAAESLPPITQLRRLGNADGRRWPRASEPQATAVAGLWGAVSRWRQRPEPGLKGHQGAPRPLRRPAAPQPAGELAS